jgi:hypothetical protein
MDLTEIFLIGQMKNVGPVLLQVLVAGGDPQIGYCFGRCHQDLPKTQ